MSERQIKFRGKSLSTGEWVYGYYYAVPMTFNGSTEISHAIVDSTGFIFKVDPKTVGQYIGIKDTNDKEIYADDITDHKPVFEARYVVKYLASAFYLCPNNEDYGEHFSSLFAGHDGKDQCKSIIVIGNIHDNKNLLTQ